MSPAEQIFYGVRAAAPDANPFVAIAYTLYQSLYSPMSSFYMNSITALHVLYAVCVVNPHCEDGADLLSFQSSFGVDCGPRCSCPEESWRRLGVQENFDG